MVGFPLVRARLRRELKAIPFDGAGLTNGIRAEIAEHGYLATLQPASSFMSSVRARLRGATRAGSGGARVGGSYIKDAVFNPRVLISLLNIYRVAFNYLELRPYASPYELESLLEGEEEPVVPRKRKVRYPGSNETVEVQAKIRQVIIKKTPAMRHGIEAYRRRKDGEAAVPSLRRLTYRPWLYADTKVGAKLDPNWERSDPVVTSVEPTTDPLDQAA